MIYGPITQDAGDGGQCNWSGSCLRGDSGVFNILRADECCKGHDSHNSS